MGPERKLYQKVKKAFGNFSLIRLENNSLHGTPDLLGYNNSGHFFTIELKVTQGKKLKFSRDPWSGYQETYLHVQWITDHGA
jgi:Holliday junction resolvase